MAHLSEEAKAALKAAASEPPFQNPPQPPLPFWEYLKVISNLPPSLTPEKPVNFSGKHWKL